MITVSQIVEEYIKNHPFIDQALENNLINISSLARVLRPGIEKELFKKVDDNTIGMALRRMIKQKRKTLIDSKKILEPEEIILRSGLTSYTFLKSSTLPQCIAKFVSGISKENKYFSVVTEGVFESAIVFSKQFVSIADTIFQQEKKVAVQIHISALTLRLPTENVVTPGVYYQILKKLAWVGINIVDIVSTNTEFTLLIKDEDVEKTLRELKK